MEVEGPGGTETLLFSNRRYTPNSGPYAGVPFRASWTRKSAARWTLKKNGMTFHDLSPAATKKWHQLSQDAAKKRMLDRLASAKRPTADAEAIWKAYHKQ